MGNVRFMLRRLTPKKIDDLICFDCFTEEQKKEMYGDGPWCREPDIIRFYHLGIECLIKRRVGAEQVNDGSIHYFGGQLNGYCKIDIEHPLFGADISEIPEEVHKGAHCGITFSDANEWGDWFIGYDCSHAWDITPSTQKLMQEMEARGDFKPLKFELPLNMRPVYRDVYFNIYWCKQLAEAIKAMVM